MTVTELIADIDASRRALDDLAAACGLPETCPELQRSRRALANARLTADQLAAAAPPVNVSIQRIEVVSDDPDRFLRGLADAARAAAAPADEGGAEDWGDVDTAVETPTGKGKQ